MTSAIVLLDRAGGAPLSTSFRKAPLGGADPFASGREIAWSGADAMSAGRVGLAGEIVCGAFPHVEALIVVTGHLRLTEAGKAPLELRPGLGAVIARGTALTIEAAPGTRFVFCAAQGEASAVPGITALEADAPLSPSSPPPAEFLVGPVPKCRSFNAFDDDTTRFRAGTWDSTPYHRVKRPHRVNELMHLVEGSVDLTGPDGNVVHVGTGDTVFVPYGAPCAWDSDVHVAKYYVVQEFGG